MTKKLCLSTLFCLLSFSILTYANEMSFQYSPEANFVSDSNFYNGYSFDEPDDCYCSFQPRKGFYLGIGESYNSVKIDRHFRGRTNSEVFIGPTLFAFGEAGGVIRPYHKTHCTYSPEVQIGYFNHFACNDCWLYGAKFYYKYLDVDFVDDNINFPDTILTSPPSSVPPPTFSGNLHVASVQTQVNHELALLAFIGHSFCNGHIYLGAGPVVFGTKTKIYNSIGFANINGLISTIVGETASFSNEKWVWGGAAQLGLVYYITPCWFLDVNYKYAATGRYKVRKSSFFESLASGFIRDTGTLSVHSSQRITAQSLSISLNKIF